MPCGGVSLGKYYLVSPRDLFQMDETAVSMYCKFCNDMNTDTADVAGSMSKLLIVFQKNVSHRDAYAQILPEGSFINWDGEGVVKRDRVFSDSSSWVALMRYFESDGDLRQVVKDHAVLRHQEECLKAAGLPLDMWGFVALYFLVNVHGLQALTVMERFFSMIYNKGVHTEALTFFSTLANRQFDRGEQTKVLVDLLTRHVKFKVAMMQQELELLQLREKDLESVFKQRLMLAMIGRPKLRSKLRVKSERDSTFQMDLFVNWCALIRFPNVFSVKQRKRLYFLMSQVHMDHARCIREVLQDQELGDRVILYPVKKPEIEILCESIMECRIVSEPFAELHHFRARCFDSFSMEHKARMRLNDLLRLYIAAYQNPAVWKSVWKMIFPVLSIQIIRDVESFVDQTPFHERQVLGILFDLREEERKPLREKGVVRQAEDAVHVVGGAELPAEEPLQQGLGGAAPLEDEPLAIEPAPIHEPISLFGGDWIEGAVPVAKDVEYEDPWALVDEKLAPQEGPSGAEAAEAEGGVGHIDHLTGGDEDKRVEWVLDEEKVFGPLGEPSAEPAPTL